jgi:hypothetical protein
MEEQVDIYRMSYIAIIGSVFILAFIVELIRKNKLKEKYALLWLFFGIIFLFLSLFRNVLEIVAKIIGIDYAPAALFLTLIIAMFFILLHYSIVVSELSEKNITVIQELGLLKFELKKLKEKIRQETFQ